MAATQLGDVVERLAQAGRWLPGGPGILIVMGSGCSVGYFSHVLPGWPTVVVGRLCSFRVMLCGPGSACSGP